MLKYTTYKSIYETPESASPASFLESCMKRWGKGAIKLVLFLLLLSVTGTGVVSAFASSDSSSNKQESATVVIVHGGDTLWEIALDNKPASEDTRVYVERIKRFNDLHSSNIRVGDTLRMP
ncbi:LysM peptidoglycan-binding domain-containing protein [Paenibacillus brevis]|uniref:LysM peptidoglycan-binding domain-containing protein n=1 Tax=Paenibacillus brevis TaxID=2841508 RepID=A0ABS6FST6_9BACL|nr:LysM peptidoglycan-binding domain-containing protein [Paenibacillus brevis]MBU5672478.1 LysM peptidoglycan-binding domain-containing protein [Paenibacillus brevis]